MFISLLKIIGILTNNCVLQWVYPSNQRCFEHTKWGDLWNQKSNRTLLGGYKQSWCYALVCNINWTYFRPLLFWEQKCYWRKLSKHFSSLCVSTHLILKVDYIFKQKNPNMQKLIQAPSFCKGRLGEDVLYCGHRSLPIGNRATSLYENRPNEMYVLHLLTRWTKT